MMEWNECIEQAKQELGITGWCNNWGEVVDLAKQIYWQGETFKNLKEDTIDFFNGRCELCSNTKNLTAHHINYGNNQSTMCVCNKCHDIIHELQKRYGFILQIVLWTMIEEMENFPDNLYSICLKVNNELIERCNKNDRNP